MIFHPQHDTRNVVSQSNLCLHWWALTSNSSIPMEQNIGAGGLQGATLSAETWTWHSQPNLKHSFESWRNPEGFRLGRHWHAIDLQTKIPPREEAGSWEPLVNHHQMLKVFIITSFGAVSRSYGRDLRGRLCLPDGNENITTLTCK